jgi:hypothetical protein
MPIFSGIFSLNETIRETELYMITKEIYGNETKKAIDGIKKEKEEENVLKKK